MPLQMVGFPLSSTCRQGGKEKESREEEERERLIRQLAPALTSDSAGDCCWRLAGWGGSPTGSRSRVDWGLSGNLETCLVQSYFASCQQHNMYLTYSPGYIKIQSNTSQRQVVCLSLCTPGSPWRERSGLVSGEKGDQKATWMPRPHLTSRRGCHLHQYHRFQEFTRREEKGGGRKKTDWTGEKYNW